MNSHEIDFVYDLSREKLHFLRHSEKDGEREDLRKKIMLKCMKRKSLDLMRIEDAQSFQKIMVLLKNYVKQHRKRQRQEDSDEAPPPKKSRLSE
ncbi:hypothetical protein QR680_016295 [Steinernema hermaphroditum]|uniref:Uncharacterized protein n=1 Tax=Steinernema hermaphroditum TaxID=289476 RepID=A0AA39LM37_9BILA|nr:hypothetical protein QR680_016295 [Steinernema hermaphroditum]